ncbi:MAG: VapE family protein [Cyclobacteriaceae bacterium]
MKKIKLKLREIAEVLYMTYCVNIVGYTKNSKSPMGRWQYAQSIRQTETQAFNLKWHLLTGLGIILGPIGNMHAFDLDKALYPEAQKLLKVLGLPEDYPWLVETGGGGYHIYFTSEGLLEKFNQQKVVVMKESGLDCKQIELRINGLIVAPGSTHQSGKVYEFVNDNQYDKPMAFIGAEVISEVVNQLTPKAQSVIQCSTSDSPDISDNDVNENVDELFDQTTYERALDVVSQLREKGIKPSLINDYSNWVNDLLLPIGNEFREQGRALFHEVSSLSLKYQKEKCDEFYTAYLKGESKHKKNKRTIKSFFYAFRQIGIIPRVHQVSELQPEEANPYFITVQILTTRHKIRRDLFTEAIYFDGKVLDDETLCTALVYLQSKYDFSKITKDFILSVCESDYVEKFHRIDELVKDYTPVNPKGNIQKITDSLITDTASGVTVNWHDEKRPLKEVLVELYFVKLMEQFYKPVANDFCLVLLGDGYLGKTHWLLHILPSQISDLVRITQFSNTKDFQMLLCSSALLIIDEIREKDMSSNEFMKQTMTTPEFPLRLPYGRTYKMRKRIASLAGTGNNNTILRDPTGNRRFIPFWLDKIDKDLANSVNRMDLFHEIYSLYKSGYDTRLTDELLEAISDLSKDFEVKTEADECLLEHCPPWNPKDRYAELLSVGEIRDLILNKTKRNLTYTQIGMSLQRLKYEKKTAWNVTYSGSKSKVWKFYCSTDPEIIRKRPASTKGDSFETPSIFLNGNGDVVMDGL